jgi:hypothetical protein
MKIMRLERLDQYEPDQGERSDALPAVGLVIRPLLW